MVFTSFKATAIEVRAPLLYTTVSIKDSYLRKLDNLISGYRLLT